MAGRLLTTTLLLALAVSFARAQEDLAVRAKTTTFPDGSYSEVIVDPRERTMRSTNHDASGKVTGKVLHKLNAKMEPVESFAYDPAGKPLYRTELKQDASGRVTEALDYTPKNKLIRRIVYTYDSLGQVSGVKAYDAAGNEIPMPKKRTP